MALSVATVRERWDATGGQDPLFAAIDGRNCPHLPAGDPAAHSLLLDARPVPRRSAVAAARRRRARRSTREFTIEVVRDPTGCNTHPALRPDSRRADGLGVPPPASRREHEIPDAQQLRRRPVHRQGARLPAVRDPETGLPTSMNMMADARATTLKAQAARRGAHAPRAAARLAPAALQRPRRLRGADLRGAGARRGGRRSRRAGGPPGLRPARTSRPARPACSATTPRAGCFRSAMRGGSCRTAAAARARSASAARVDRARPRRVHVPHVLDPRLDAPEHASASAIPMKRTCSTCHGMHMTGMDVANGWMDIGTTNLPWAREAPLNPWTTRRAAAAAVQDHLQRRHRAARVPRPRDLHAGSGPRAGHGQVQRRRRDRHAAVPRARGARAVLLERLRARRCASSSTSTTGASTSATPSKRSEDLDQLLERAMNARTATPDRASLQRARSRRARSPRGRRRRSSATSSPARSCATRPPCRAGSPSTTASSTS